jgi:hypothetical protein
MCPLAGFVRVGVEGQLRSDRPRTRDPALASSLRIGAVLQAIGFKPE